MTEHVIRLYHRNVASIVGQQGVLTLVCERAIFGQTIKTDGSLPRAVLTSLPS